MLRKCILATLLVISIFLSFGLVNASAIIDNVQSGTVSVSGTGTDVTISSVNTSRSILFFTHTVGSNQPNGFLMRGDITSSTNIRFERQGTNGGNVEVAWYVAEFIEGVDVESQVINHNTAIFDQTINGVNLSSSFPIVSWENGGTTWGNDDNVRSQLTSSTNLRLQGSTPITDSLAYQVVNFNGSNVQQGTVQITGTTATVDINEVDLNKSFILASGYTGSNVGANDIGFVVNFTNSTRIQFERDTAGGTIEAGYHVVELTGDERVLTGYSSMDASTTQLDVTIDSINTSRAVAFAAWNGRSGKSPETDDNAGTIYFTMEITNETNLRLNRAATGGDPADVEWFVVEFAGEVNIAPQDPTLVSLDPIIDPLPFNYTDLNSSGFIFDSNNDTLTVEVRWYNNSVLVREENFTNQISNTTFSTVLNSTNTSIGESWIFSMRIHDAEFSSNWVNSSSVLIRDPSAPVINITSPLNTTYTQVITSLDYTISNTTALNNCWYSTDSGANNISITCNQNVTSINSSEGDNIWTVYANDTNGNVGFRTVQFFVDSIAPTVSITSPSTSETDYTLPLNVSIGDLSEAVVYSINSGTNRTLCTNCSGALGNFIVLEEGSTQITVYANDSFGNIGSDTVTVSLDEGSYLFETFTDNATIVSNNSVEVLEGNLTFRSSIFVPLDIVLACGAATCASTSSDVPIYNRLVAAGHNVSNFSDSDTSWSVADYDLVVISESANSGNTLFMETRAIPILSLEGATFDEHHLGSGGGSNTNGGTVMTILNNTHYVTQIFTLGQNVTFSTGGNMGAMSGWANDVQALGVYQSATGQSPLLTIEAGGTLSDSSIAADKRAYFAGFTFTNLNSNGLDIFDRLVEWAGSSNAVVSNGSVVSQPLNLTEDITAFDNITWTEDNTNEGNNITVELSVDGGTTWLNTTRNEGVFNFTVGDSLVFRVNFTGNETRDIALLDLNISWADLDVPTVTLVNPLNDSFIISNGSINLTWFITDSDLTINCDLYVNDVLNTSSTCNTGENSSVLVPIAKGSYTWYVSVNDSDGNIVNSSVNNFTIIDGRNLSVSKTITGGTSSNFYLVTLKVTNEENQTLDITLFDFVNTPEFVYGSFNDLYDFVNVTNGTKYNGTVLGWNLTLLAQESRIINYSLASTGNFRVSNNWPFGLD